MRRVAVVLAVAAVVAGCGGAKKKQQTAAGPTTALLTKVEVSAKSVRFEFRTQPQDVKARFQPRSQLAECGSGRPVRIKGTSYVVVHFTPAATADIQGEKVIPTYKGPKRLHGPGPVLETAKLCDFEADVGWAIGIAKRMPIHVSRDGSAVTVSFG